MANLTSYFVKNSKRLVPQNKYIIKGKTYRFTVLTPRLIRLEYSKKGAFEDRATSLVINRTFDDFNFTIGGEDPALVISTEYFTLTYAKETPFTSNSIRLVLTGTDREWYPGHKEVRNVGSIGYSLDDISGNNSKSGKGLYSLDGFCVLDDSKNYVIDNEIFLPRDKDTIDLYIFAYRTDLGLCLQDYFNLTGYPPMIPRYALGAWWYKNDRYNMYEIDNTIKNFYDNKIPISVFLLGNSWHPKEYPFNYDNTLFDVRAIKGYYQGKKQKFGLTINPELSIRANDPLFPTINGYMPTDKNQISFIPLSNNAISAYFNIIVGSLMDSGVKLFNIDYYNPSDLYDMFLLNHYHYAIANLQERGVILSRNAGIAPHRYPVIYSGKTLVSWDTLKKLAGYNISASNLGVCWYAHAIGGYFGGIEDDELFIRYIQFGVFNPIFILAGEAGKYYKREPWRWNQINLSVIRDFMQLRNKLIPYIYNEGYLYHKFGVPMIQPLYYRYPRIYDEPNYVNQYFFGSRIMISPIIKRKNLEMNRVVQRVFIPSGIWYDYSSGKKYIGNRYYVGFYKDEDYPIFVKEGSIIPMSLDLDTNNPKNMEIQIYPAENGLYGSYELYEDDGISINVGKNNYLITKMNLDKVDEGYKFTITRKEGNYNLPNRDYVLRFRNMKSPDKVLIMNGTNEIESTFEVEKNDLIVKIADASVYAKIEVTIVGKELEIETISVINEEIRGILDDLEIRTILKEQIDAIIFSDLSIKKKRIALRKLKKDKLEPKYINMFIGLLEFINYK